MKALLKIHEDDKQIHITDEIIECVWCFCILTACIWAIQVKCKPSISYNVWNGLTGLHVNGA